MRLILTTIILTMLAQPVWAMSNEVLYKSCKPFAERGFELDLNSMSRRFEDGVCLGYVYAVIEQAYYVCQSTQSLQKLGKSYDEFKRGANTVSKWHGSSATLDDVNAVIQSFINWAEDNPSDWQYFPNAEHWLAPTFPCNE